MLIVYLEIAEQVLEGRLVGYDGRLASAVDGANQRKRQVQDMAVQQVALLLEQHRQRLYVHGNEQR